MAEDVKRGPRAAGGVFTGPLRLLPVAIRAVPAVRYALATLAVTGCVAAAIGYLRDARLALIGTIAGLGLMALMVIFSHVAKLEGSIMRRPAIVFVWFSLALFVVWAGGMTTSVFVGFPLHISLFARAEQADGPPFALIVPDEASVLMMSPGKPSPFTLTIGSASLALPATGLLIGTIADLPGAARDEYRHHVTEGQPVRHRVAFDREVARSLKVAYQGHPCRDPELADPEQTTWLVRFAECPH